MNRPHSRVKTVEEGKVKLEKRRVSSSKKASPLSILSIISKAIKNEKK